MVEDPEWLLHPVLQELKPGVDQIGHMEDQRVILTLLEGMLLQELREIAEQLLQIVPREHILQGQEGQERLTQEILLQVLVE